MKRRVCSLILVCTMLLSVMFGVICTEAHAQAVSLSKTSKNGIVIEKITVETTTSKKDITAAKKKYGEELTDDAILLKTVIHGRSYMSSTVYDTAFQLNYLVPDEDFWENEIMYLVDSVMVYGDTAAVKSGQAFTATGYRVISDPEQLCQYVHIDQLYFKDTKTASAWIMAVPTESPTFEFKGYQKAVSKLQPSQSEFNVGDIVTFGSYEQDNKTAEKEPIEWIVLDRDGTKLLLLSRYCLDSVAFNSKKGDVKWEDSSLRKWLNTTFLKKAFSATAQSMLVYSTIETEDNPTYGTSGCNDTEDRVFLLSIDEVEMYFAKDTDRRADATAYADAQGAQVYKTGAWWRLRSPGKYDYSVASVYASGKIAYDGDSAWDSGCAIRPAVWVDLAG